MTKRKCSSDEKSTTKPAETKPTTAAAPVKPTYRLLHFAAPAWCPACKEMEKRHVIERFAAEYPEVDCIKLNLNEDDSPDSKVADAYDIMNMPTMVFERIPADAAPLGDDEQPTRKPELELARDSGAMDVEDLEELFERAKKATPATPEG